MQSERRREEEKEQHCAHVQKELKNDATERALIDPKEILHPARRGMPKQHGGEQQQDRQPKADNEGSQQNVTPKNNEFSIHKNSISLFTNNRYLIAGAAEPALSH